LQRAITDFGADVSFEQTSKKMLEHYGVELPSSTIRLIVEEHAHNIEKNLDKLQAKKSHKEVPKTIIAQIDGGMVPVVEIPQDVVGDRRKARSVAWKECRLSLAYAHGTIDPTYAATMGDVDEAGAQLAKVVKLAGQEAETHIHAVGDGAPWIANQVEKKFGSDASYLLDLFHLSEYLCAAGECLDKDNPNEWGKIQQDRMKIGKVTEVITELEQHIYSDNEEHVCEAQKCHGYLMKRLTQLDYPSAIKNDLPIGSGEIESAHRSIVQKRMKLAGGWWLPNNASAMINLRVLRANGNWGSYWPHSPGA
jgi:hypothetical protein